MKVPDTNLITHFKHHNLVVPVPVTARAIFLVCFVIFLLMSLANGLSILFIFSENQLFVSLIFAIVSLISFPFISDLICMISFLLLTLGFFFAFLSLIALGVRLGCLFEMFLVS